MCALLWPFFFEALLDKSFYGILQKTLDPSPLFKPQGFWNSYKVLVISHYFLPQNTHSMWLKCLPKPSNYKHENISLCKFTHSLWRRKQVCIKIHSNASNWNEPLLHLFQYIHWGWALYLVLVEIPSSSS